MLNVAMSQSEILAATGGWGKGVKFSEDIFDDGEKVKAPMPVTFNPLISLEDSPMETDEPEPQRPRLVFSGSLNEEEDPTDDEGPQTPPTHEVSDDEGDMPPPGTPHKITLVDINDGKNTKEVTTLENDDGETVDEVPEHLEIFMAKLKKDLTNLLVSSLV